MDALLRDRDAPMVKLDLQWTLFWETEMLLQSNSTYNGCSPERWRRFCGQTRLTMDAFLRDGDVSTVKIDLQWMLSQEIMLLWSTWPIMGALLRGRDAPSFNLDLQWTLSWETEMILSSKLTYNGCSPERWRHSYSQNWPMMGVVLRDRNAPMVKFNLQWKIFQKMEALLMVKL